MTKKVYRFYSMFLEKQEMFLNKMAGEGWRLIKTTRLSYTFEPCTPNEYEYQVLYIGNKAQKDNKDYRAFLQKMGYDVFVKAANLNYSVGKIRWRPTADNLVNFATNPGAYNKEIIIVGKKRGDQPLEVYTTHSDRADYYGKVRNVHISLLAMAILMLSLIWWQNGIQSASFLAGAALCLLLLYPTILYARKAKRYAEMSETSES